MGDETGKRQTLVPNCGDLDFRSYFIARGAIGGYYETNMVIQNCSNYNMPGTVQNISFKYSHVILLEKLLLSSFCR